MSVMLGILTGLVGWGSGISEILQEWETMGIFEFVLPFLLIFAIVFGILMSSKIIGEHRGINMVISLAIALLGITSVGLRSFFRVIFPYTGIGLSILIVILILTGLFAQTEAKWWKYTFFGISAVIAIVIVLSALSSYQVAWNGSWWWQQYGNALIVGAIVIGLILFVVLPKKEGSSTPRQ